MLFENERQWMGAHAYAIRLAVWAIVVVALLGAFAWQRVRYERLEDRHRELAMRSVNDAAAADSSRSVALSARDSLRLLGDSIQAVTRLTMQLRQESDALERALGQASRRARVGVRVRVDTLRVSTIAAVSIDSADVRRATFRVDSTPWRATADVALPARGPGTLALRVALEPAHLSLRSTCGPRNADGVRPASVVVTGPRWLELVVERTEQAPEVCNPPAPARRRWLGAPAIVAGYGYTATAAGVRPGAFVGIGARFGF